MSFDKEKENTQKEKQEVKFEVNYISEVEKQLTDRLGRRVRVVDGRKKGRIEIEYYGDEDMQTVIELLSSLGK